MAMSSAVHAVEWASPFEPVSDTPRFDTTADARDDNDQEDEQEDESQQVTPYIEELFLGRIVYPQEAGEVQLTGGFFQGAEAQQDAAFLFEVEYGITDQLQIGFEANTHLGPDESFQGLQQCSVEVYYNFYSERCTGSAYGVGFEFGPPIDATPDEPRACVFEPFFIAYQEYRTFAVNLSAAVEIADPVVRDEATDVAGDVSLAIFRRTGNITAILESSVEFDAEESPVRLAPALYWQPFDAPFDLAVSLPIGLNRDAPKLGVFLLAIYEFPAARLARR